MVLQTDILSPAVVGALSLEVHSDALLRFFTCQVGLTADQVHSAWLIIWTDTVSLTHSFQKTLVAGASTKSQCVAFHSTD